MADNVAVTSGSYSATLRTHEISSGLHAQYVLEWPAPAVTTWGNKSSISTSALQMTTSSIPLLTGLSVKADPANAGLVYVGGDNTVTHGTVDATDGYCLAAGESVTLNVSNANLVWLIASAASQRVSWIGV